MTTTTALAGAAELMSLPLRFDSRGYVRGGKVHALTNDHAGDSPHGRLVETVCGRTGPFSALWDADSWSNIVKGGFACANCVKRAGR